MKYSFCTVITLNYLPYAQVLRDSLVAQQANTVLYVFIADYKANTSNELIDKKNIAYIFIDDLCEAGIGRLIFEKYFNTNPDAFRWSMKAVLMNFILEKFADKTIYADCDICFYGDFKFLLDTLDTANVLITPHWNASLPRKDMENFLAAFRWGIYNAGFIAANKKAKSALDWYANASYDLCITEVPVCHYADQSHLNLLPIFFDGVEIVKHRGCNISGWNAIECKISVNENGAIVVNYIDPLIFVHYSIHWMKPLLNDNAPLKSYAENYIKRLAAYGFNIEKIHEFINPKPEPKVEKKKKWWKRR